MLKPAKARNAMTTIRNTVARVMALYLVAGHSACKSREESHAYKPDHWGHDDHCHHRAAILLLSPGCSIALRQSATWQPSRSAPSRTGHTRMKLNRSGLILCGGYVAFLRCCST